MDDKAYNVPENAVTLKYWVMFAMSGWAGETGFGQLYEIQPDRGVPQIVVSSEYPIITLNDGVIGKYVTLNQDAFATKSYYKVEDSEWKEYNGEQIKIEAEETIYARGSWGENIYTRIVSYKDSNNSMPKEAYDGDDETFVKMHQNTPPGTDTRYLSIDKSLWNKKIRIKCWQWGYGSYHGTISFLDKDDNVLTSYNIPYAVIYDEKYDVPENAVTLKYWSMFPGEAWSPDEGNAKVYEIQAVSE